MPKPPITIGDIYSALGKTLNYIIREDVVRKNEDSAYGKLKIAVIGNFRVGATRFIVTYERKNSNEEPVVYWREDFDTMDKAIKFYNEAANGELADVDY